MRNSLYADMAPWFVGRNGVIRAPAGKGRVAWVSRRDVAIPIGRPLVWVFRTGNMLPKHRMIS